MLNKYNSYLDIVALNFMGDVGQHTEKRTANASIFVQLMCIYLFTITVLLRGDLANFYFLTRWPFWLLKPVFVAVS